MVKLICDTCDADITNTVNAWNLTLAEIKHNDNSITMHLCDDCQKEVLKRLESVVKSMLKDNADGPAKV